MKLLKVPYIDQSGRYPTGCESVSAVMLLHYLGIQITVDEFIQNYLEKREFEIRNGQIYGADPRQFFCGSPYDADSMGCYAPVICRSLRKILGGRYEVADETGSDTRALLQRYIDRGMPVLYWACIEMRNPVRGPQWRLFDSGDVFTWISNEHCMLLVGYDEEGYYFNDPYEGHGLVRYPRERTEQCHEAQYAMAVGVRSLEGNEE